MAAGGRRNSDSVAKCVARCCGPWLVAVLLIAAAGWSGEAPAAAEPAPTPSAAPEAGSPPLPDYTRFSILRTYPFPAVTPPIERPQAPGQQAYPYHNHYGGPSTTWSNWNYYFGPWNEADSNHVVLSADGTRLLVHRKNDTLAQVWDRTRGEVLATFKNPYASLTSVDLSPDGRLVAAMDTEQTVILWDVVGETELKRFATQAIGRLFFVSNTQVVWVHAPVNGAQYQVELCEIPTFKTLAKADDVLAVELKPGAVCLISQDNQGDFPIQWFDGKAVAPQKLDTLPAAGMNQWFRPGTTDMKIQMRADHRQVRIGDPYSNGVCIDIGQKKPSQSVPFARFTADGRYCVAQDWNTKGLVMTDAEGDNKVYQPIGGSVVMGDSWAVDAHSRVLAAAMTDRIRVALAPYLKPLGDLVSARGGNSAEHLFMADDAQTLLACFDDRAEEWGLETNPLPYESDRAFTVYMDQLGLKHSLFTAVIYDTPAQLRQAIADHPEWLTQVDPDGGTPLHYAIAANRRDNAAVLLAAGANPNQADNRQLTPIALAFSDWNLPMLRLLEQHGAQVPPSWGSYFYSWSQRANIPRRGYGRVQVLTEAPATWKDMMHWLVDHDLEADPRQIALAVHNYERNDPVLAQKIYNRFQRIPIHWLALMQLMLIGMGLLRVYRQRRVSLDPVKQRAQSDSLRLRHYHSSPWGDDSRGQLGLYPEEQRQLAALKHRADAVLAAPLPMLLGYVGVLAVGAVIPYWWLHPEMEFNTGLLFVLGLTWIFGHLQHTGIRIRMHWLGLAAGVAGGVYGLVAPFVIPGIHDFLARAVYFVAGLGAIPLVWLYAQNLRLLQRIARMEKMQAKVPVVSNEEVKSDSGWDERQPEVF